MHYKLLVTTSKDNARTSEQAQSYVEDYLQDNGFVSDGRFSSGYSDWFVIGGRWTGELLPVAIREQHIKDVKELLGVKEGDWLTNKQIEENADSIQLLWEEAGNDGHSILLLNTYNSIEQDAMIVDERIYAEQLAEFEGCIGESEDDMHWIDIEWDECNRENMIGKWVVVVDYHN